ncbi:MAG: hypothetical protein K2X47_19270 [Bdellovibrionales bacterium]|nr:hypothetical protein [Bdellovibrionales bacterium]
MMFPGYPVKRIQADTLEIGVSGEGSVFVQDMKMAAGLPRLMVFAKMPLDPRNSNHEIHWYRVAQILNTDIRGVTFIYNNNDPKMGQPVLLLRSSMAFGPSGQSIDMIALYCEVVAIFESKRIMQEVLSVSLNGGVLRADMYDKTEGMAQSLFRVIHPGADSVRPVNGEQIWKETLGKARRRLDGMSLRSEGRDLRVTLESGLSGVVGYHEGSHTLTIEHVLSEEVAEALIGTRSSFEISELINVLHTLHPMGCFEFDQQSGRLKYGSLFRLVKAPTWMDVGLLASEMDAVRVVIQEVIQYQQELEGAPSAA